LLGPRHMVAKCDHRFVLQFQLTDARRDPHEAVAVRWIDIGIGTDRRIEGKFLIDDGLTRRARDLDVEEEIAVGLQYLIFECYGKLQSDHRVSGTCGRMTWHRSIARTPAIKIPRYDDALQREEYAATQDSVRCEESITSRPAPGDYLAACVPALFAKLCALKCE